MRWVGVISDWSFFLWRWRRLRVIWIGLSSCWWSCRRLMRRVRVCIVCLLWRFCVVVWMLILCRLVSWLGVLRWSLRIWIVGMLRVVGWRGVRRVFLWIVFGWVLWIISGRSLRIWWVNFRIFGSGWWMSIRRLLSVGIFCCFIFFIL